MSDDESAHASQVHVLLRVRIYPYSSCLPLCRCERDLHATLAAQYEASQNSLLAQCASLRRLLVRCLERFAAALAPAARLFRAAREREAKTDVCYPVVFMAWILALTFKCNSSRDPVLSSEFSKVLKRISFVLILVFFQRISSLRHRCELAIQKP